MVFRTVGAIATVLTSISSQALGQYSPQVYPREALPPAVNADELPPLNVPSVQDHPLPPVGVGTTYPQPHGAPYDQGTIDSSVDAAPLPPTSSPGPGYQPQPAAANPYGLRGAIPPGPPGSARQDAIREEAIRSRLRNSPGQVDSTTAVIRPTQSGDQGDTAALPPEVRPESGPKQELAAQFRRTLIHYRTKEPAGTIIIDTPNTYLYLVLGNGKALRYGVGVGREGFTWSGLERITRMLEWPDWTPPQEMIMRQPYLPRFMAGGETNPLGARALYLGNTVYRIHGTNQPSTIGTFVSSGCIRLTNEDVMDLYRRIRVGTRVVVLPGRPPAKEALGTVPATASGNAPLTPIQARPQPPPGMAR